VTMYLYLAFQNPGRYCEGGLWPTVVLKWDSVLYNNIPCTSVGYSSRNVLVAVLSNR